MVIWCISWLMLLGTRPLHNPPCVLGGSGKMAKSDKNWKFLKMQFLVLQVHQKTRTYWNTINMHYMHFFVHNSKVTTFTPRWVLLRCSTPKPKVFLDTTTHVLSKKYGQRSRIRIPFFDPPQWPPYLQTIGDTKHTKQSKI